MTTLRKSSQQSGWTCLLSYSGAGTALNMYSGAQGIQKLPSMLAKPDGIYRWAKVTASNQSRPAPEHDTQSGCQVPPLMAAQHCRPPRPSKASPMPSLSVAAPFDAWASLQ